MNRTRIGVFVLVCVAATLLVSSGSYATVDASRGVQLGVADEPTDGLLGVQSLGPVTAEVGESFPVVSLTDNFATEDVTVDSASVPDDAPISVESAEMDGDVEVTCDEATEDGKSVTLEIAVSGEEVDVLKNKEVTVTCEPDPDPEFNGCGSVDTHPAVEIDERIYEDTPSGQDSKLIAVVIDEERYENPNNCNDGQSRNSTDNAGNR